MSLEPLSAFPDEARVWVFGASERPAQEAVARLRDSMARFLERWTAHRAELRAGFDWLDDRFLVVAVDETGAGASGCSIDALTDQIRRLEDDAGVTLIDAAPVWYRDDDGEIRRVARDEFRHLAAGGEVGPRTRVFDLTIDRLGTLRTGTWETEAGRSWHAALL